MWYYWNSITRHIILMKNDLNPFAFFSGNGIGRPFFFGIFWWSIVHWKPSKKIFQFLEIKKEKGGASSIILIRVYTTTFRMRMIGKCSFMLKSMYSIVAANSKQLLWKWKGKVTPCLKNCKDMTNIYQEFFNNILCKNQITRVIK